MTSMFAAQGRLAASHPWLALGLVAALSVVFGAGLFAESEGPGDDAAAFLPEDSVLAQAQAKIAEDFASQSTTVGVQIIIRGGTGDVLSPAALREVKAAFDAVEADARVAEFLLPGTFSPAHMLEIGVGGDLSTADASAIHQAFISFSDQLQGLLACRADVCTPDNTFAMLGFINLDGSDGSAEARAALDDAQLAIEDVLDDHAWSEVEGRSFSGAKLNEEASAAEATSTALLMGLAFAVIIVVLVVFYRTGTDVALSIGGLVLTIVWVYGIQGLLGPGMLGIIGGDSPFAMMIPILLIGLTVDYALQFTGRYREALGEGRDVKEAISEAVTHSAMPLLLAAGTTAISFATNMTSSMPPMRDFGLIAAIGVMMGWFVMITFVPAIRSILDAARARRGKKVQDRHMAEAIPGVGKAIAGISSTIVRRPALYLGIAGVITVVAAFGAVNVETTFSQSDFLPKDAETTQDLEFLSAHFGGGGGTASLLVEGDLTDSDVLRSLVSVEQQLADAAARPDGVTGPVRASFLTLAFDWAVDDGLPGDEYDPAMLGLLMALDRFFPPADDLMAVFDRLQEVDPAGFASVVALHDDGPDRTIIVVPVVTGDPDATAKLKRDLERLWDGGDDMFFLTGGDFLTNEVTDTMTDGQTESVIITIMAALVLLVVFFGVTERRPALGVITVLPIALVVLWVLGSMAALGISYNIMTALITALTIGVGVDYTIHVTHRFLEEYAEGKGVDHAVTESLSTTGGALIGSALTTALGFSVLVLSPLAPMQQFGGLTALTIVYSLIASFVVLPPMLVLWALFDGWRRRQAVQRLLEDAPITAAPASGAVRVTAISDGLELRCPQCRTACFVPRHVERMECPSCAFTGSNPHARAAE